MKFRCTSKILRRQIDEAAANVQMLMRGGRIAESCIGDWAQALVLVTADAEGLAASVKNTCDLSERVSIKVRELDSAQVRSRALILHSIGVHHDGSRYTV